MDWKRKLTSRKFWAALSEFVAMLVIALKGTQETATQVTALIMAGAAVIAYIIGEGLIDAAGAAPETVYHAAGDLYLNGEQVAVDKPPEADVEDAFEKSEDW